MAFLAALGNKIFGKRLYIGLAVALVGLEVLVPQPFLAAPYATMQIAAVCCIAAGIALRAWGSGTAGRHTRSSTIEAARLVTSGPFAYVRNPIYLGTIFISLGMSSLIGDPLAYLMAALALGLLYFGIIPAEEDHLNRTFGEEYAQYRAAVPRLIPRIVPWSGARENAFDWRHARGELFIAMIVVLIYLALQFEEYLDRMFPWA